MRSAQLEKGLAFLAIILVLVSQCPGGEAMPPCLSGAETNTTVIIGGLFSVHTNTGGRCGKIRESPFINVEAMIFAVDSINANSSLLPDINLTCSIRDTCGISNRALEETVGLMEINTGGSEGSIAGISGIVGASQSEVSISVASLLRIFQVPQISYASTATALSDKQRFDYFFRTIPPDSLQAQAIADLILHFNWSYIIGVHTDDTYGRGGMASLAKELSQRNGTQVCLVTGEETAVPSQADEVHYDRLLSFIGQRWVRNASIVVLFGQQRTAIGLLEAIRRSGLSYQHLTWIASDAWSVNMPSDYHDSIRGMLGVVPRVQRVEEFVSYYESLTPGNHSTNPWFEEYWEEEFNCTFDSESYRERQSCEELDNSLRLSYNNNTSNGVEYVIDAVYAFAHAIQSLVDNSCPLGTTELCSDILTEKFSHGAVSGRKLRENLQNISFLASLTSNRVAFDETGDQQGFYEIVNLGTHGLRKVGTWNSEDLLEISEKIEWRSGRKVPMSLCSLPCSSGEEPEPVSKQSHCCWTCQPCAGENTASTGNKCFQCPTGQSPNQERDDCLPNPITHLTWSSPWAVVILIVTLSGLATTTFVAVVFMIFNKHKIIMATSRELSAILLTGITLCYLIPFFFIATPSPTTCAFRRFSIGFCFSLCFSPLLMKTNRIYRVFHQAPHTPRFAGPKSQVVFTCMLVSVQVCIAAVWLIVERPSIKLTHDTATTELSCGESPYVGLPVSLLYSLLMLVLTTFYAFLARKIPTKFNETKFIATTLYTICIIWLGFFPTYFATIRLGSIYQTSTLVFAVLLSATTTLACPFIPKVVLLFVDLAKRKKEGEKEGPSCSSTITDFRTSIAEL